MSRSLQEEVSLQTLIDQEDAAASSSGRTAIGPPARPTAATATTTAGISSPYLQPGFGAVGHLSSPGGGCNPPQIGLVGPTHSAAAPAIPGSHYFELQQLRQRAELEQQQTIVIDGHVAARAVLAS